MAFADFPEQRGAVELLQRSLARGRLGHAYLFAGSDLDRLEAIARTLAKTLNCERRSGKTTDLFATAPTGDAAADSCDQCDSCRRIDADNHPDVQWVRPGKKTRIIGVDQMRELMRNVFMKPHSAAYKVSILVAADRLKTEGANAFLKTLEEPPASSVLILLTTEPAQILETILSRCLRLTFAGDALRLRDPALLEWLQSFVAAALDHQGGLLGRYRLLAVLLKRLTGLKASLDEALTAKSPLQRFDDVEPDLRDRWEDELAAAIEAEYRHRRADVLLALEWWLRDVWLLTAGAGENSLAHAALAAATRTVAQRLTPDEALANVTVLERAQRQLGTNVQEALALEVALLRLKL